jgi:GGDEF domain-containing protein
MYITLSIIGLWLIYAIIIKLTKKRKYDYSFVVAFVFLLAFGYFYLDDQIDSNYYTYFSYAILALFAIWLVLDNLLLLFKKNVSEFDFSDLEDELAQTNDASELLRKRFISTIELVNDGIAFRDGEFIFGTDRFIDITGIESNEFGVEDYRGMIHKDDLPQYDMKLEKLTKKYPIYNIKYRVKKEGKYLWISERGKLLVLEKKKSYISTIKTMDIKMYPESDVDVLNTLSDFKNMYEEMQRLNRQKNSYHLVVIQLTNIPKINEKFGRDFGDLLMGEYLSKLRFKFIKDNKSLFRISGIKFGLLIKEKAKFDLLDRALVGTGELMTLQLQFGGVTQTVYPNLGISESPYGAKNSDLVIREANEALNLSLKDGFETSFCFYDRI